MSIFPTQEGFEKYKKAAILGAQAGAICLPLEHPFDTVKTRCQAVGGVATPWQITQEMWKTNGIRGFYSGAIPNGIRSIGKQTYRYPMNMGFTQFYQAIIPKNVQHAFSTSDKVATGLTIATFETYIITPLERLKVVLMTNNEKAKALTRFFQENKGGIWPELTRGLNAVYVKQITSWVSFLVADKKFRTWEKKRTQMDDWLCCINARFASSAPFLLPMAA